MPAERPGARAPRSPQYVAADLAAEYGKRAPGRGCPHALEVRHDAVREHTAECTPDSTS